jgi:RHS repeat-associated protein
MGRRVRSPCVSVSLFIVIVAIVVGFASMALADASTASSSPAPVSVATFNEGMSSAAAIPASAHEAVDKRSEYSTTFELANGSMTTVFSLTPVHYKDSAGNWLPIDVTLSLISGGNYVTTATPVKVTLTNQTSSVAPVTIDSGAGPVSLGMVGSLVDGITVSGGSARYPAVTTATDVNELATGDGVEQTLTLASAAAPSSFSFTLSHAGFNLAQDASGQWTLTKPGAAKPSYLLGALSVYDSSSDESGAPAYCDGARMAVKVGTNSSAISYSIPSSWLKDKARVWPVTVDPGVFTQNPTDTYIAAGEPSTSHGSSDALFCGKVSQQSGDCKTLVEFPGIDYDAGAIPNGAHIAAATLSVRQWWQPATHSDTVNIGRVSNGSSNWGEGSVWNGTTIDPVAMQSQTTTAMQQWVAIPCPGVVQGWERDDYANKGLVLYESSSAGSAWARKFRSGDYSDVTYRPKLSVTYDEPTMADTLPTSASSTFGIGENVSVQVTTSSVSDPTQITDIRMGTNRLAADTSLRRGVLAWFASPPTGGSWIYQKAAANGGYFAYFNSTTYGSDHITPQLASCTISADHTVATFVYTVNDNWGSPGTSEWDTYLDMSAGSSNSWSSGWVAQTAKTFTVDQTLGQPDALQSLTSSTTATSWFTGTGNDDSATQGRGTVTLSWPAVDLADGYDVYLWDGVKWDPVDSVTGTSWSSSGKNLYPTDTTLATIPQGYSGNPFTAYGTTELRDNSNALYQKIAGSANKDTDYRFRVVPYKTHNATKLSADSSSCAVLRVTLDNRTRPSTANEDPQHTTYDFGGWDGHYLAAELDSGALTGSVCDLSIATYGPVAALSRSYRSDRTAADLFAPGWFFSFQQNLQIGANQIIYTDAMHLAHTFTGSGSTWTAPIGFITTLNQDGSNWRLTFIDQSHLTFDTAGNLINETDNDGNQTTYAWTAGNVTTITAANSQQITLSYSGGKLASASYATAAGTRTVNYATSSPWQVTLYPGAAVQKKLTYAYDANTMLASITQEDWPASGQSVAESFVYTSAKLTDVRFADWNATTNPSAHASIVYATNQATIDHYGTVNGTANQTIDREVDTWDATTHLLATQTTGTAQPLTESFNYAFDRQLATTTGSDGGQTTSSVDLSHDYTSTTTTSNSASSANQLTSYAYDSVHRLTQEQNNQSPSVCATITYAYNANGDLTERQTLDANGTTVLADSQYDYDSCGRQTSDKELVSGTPQSGTWKETDYSSFAANGAPQTTIAKAVQLSYGAAAQDLTETALYDAFGNTLTQTDWSNSRVVATNTYDVAGNQLTSTDAYGIVGHTTYDCMANATESWQTASGTSMKAGWTVSAFDAMGRATSVTTKRSDASGNPTTQSVVTTTYDGNGDTLTTHNTTLGGQDAKTLYDADGNAIQTWSAGVADYTTAARSVRSVFDSSGRVIYESGPGNANAPGAASPCTAATYDTAGNALSAALPDGTKTAFAYDGQANQTTSAGAQSTLTTPWRATVATNVAGRQTVGVAAPQSHTGLATSYGTDNLGQQTSATAQRDGGGGASTQTTYNTLGWVLQTVDANGVTTSSVYDNHGCCISVTVGTKTTTRTYDADNGVLTETDADGNLLTYTYDAFGNSTRALHKNSAGTTTKDIGTSYDSLGRLTSQSEAVSGVGRSWTYPQNAATGVQETITYGASPNTSVAINRNSRAMETSRVATVATGVTVTRSVSDPNGRNTADRWTMATIQQSGRQAQSMSRSFDVAERMATQSGLGFTGAASYTYDSDTGLKSAESLPLALGGTIADSLTYFAGGNLASATTNGSTDSFAYDELGNLVTDSVAGGTATSFNYDSQNRLTQTVAVPADESLSPTTTVYGWDTSNDWRTSQGPSGNPSQITFAYNALGRLSTYHNGSGSVTNATYTYDDFGQRTKSVVTIGSSTTSTNYICSGSELMSLVATQGSSTWRVDYLRDEEGTPYGGVYLSPSTSTSPTYFTLVTSDRGDLVELCDADGNAFGAYRYDTWGLPQGAGNYATGVWTQSTSLISAALAGQIASRQALRYASYTYDSESGLCYCSARYYDPGTRQWTTGDPAKADGEASAFQYCSNSPVGTTDPTGLHPHINESRWWAERIQDLYFQGVGSEAAMRMREHLTNHAHVEVEFRFNPYDDNKWWVRQIRWHVFTWLMCSDSAAARVQGRPSGAWTTAYSYQGVKALKTWGKVDHVQLDSATGGKDAQTGDAYPYVFGENHDLDAGSLQKVWMNGRWVPGTSVLIDQELHHAWNQDRFDGGIHGRIYLPRWIHDADYFAE